MREIKFRAWDKDKNEAIDMSTLRFAIDGQTRIADMPPSRYALMQFTGLKDKNGKEIYEGDIASIDGMSVPVEWYNGAWTVRYFNVPTRSYLAHFDGSDVEIIGNIYEHPHLLTNEK